MGMMKVGAGVALMLVAVGPGIGLVGLTVLASPGSEAFCITSGPSTSTGGGEPIAPETPPETASVVFPLPAGTWYRTDQFGWRDFPPSPWHTGVDYAAADGTPIMAVADGIVTVAEFSAGWGGLIVIEHTVGGQTVATAYAHMWQHGIYVSPRQKVKAGHHIGDVGSSGLSTGAHLHFEVRPGGSYAEAIDPEPWLAAQGAIDLGGPDGVNTPAGCTPEEDEAGADDPASAPEADEVVAAREESP